MDEVHVIAVLAMVSAYFLFGTLAAGLVGGAFTVLFIAGQF